MKAKYKRLVDDCHKAIKSYYAACENKLIETGNIGSFYKFVNSKTSVRSGVPPLRDANGTIISDDLGKAELLNNLFASVFVTDDGNIPSHTPIIQPDIPYDGIYSTPALVRKAIGRIKKSCSSGDDKLPA